MLSGVGSWGSIVMETSMFFANGVYDGIIVRWMLIDTIWIKYCIIRWFLAVQFGQCGFKRLSLMFTR